MRGDANGAKRAAQSRNGAHVSPPLHWGHRGMEQVEGLLATADALNALMDTVQAIAHGSGDRSLWNAILQIGAYPTACVSIV